MKTVDIKGKKYVMVNERVMEFHKLYPNGEITTELLSPIDSDLVVMKATVIPNVYPDSNKIDRVFTGYSQASWSDTKSMVNSTSALENAETSAVGRALGFLGIGIVDSIATADEVNKAIGTTPYNERPASEKQVALIQRVVAQKMLPDQWLQKQGLTDFEQIKAKDVNKYLSELN